MSIWISEQAFSRLQIRDNITESVGIGDLFLYVMYH